MSRRIRVQRARDGSTVEDALNCDMPKTKGYRERPLRNVIFSAMKPGERSESRDAQRNRRGYVARVPRLPGRAVCKDTPPGRLNRSGLPSYR